MAKFSVDGDDYGEGPSNPPRVKRRKITPEEEECEDDVEVEPEATEDQSGTPGEYDEEGSVPEYRYYAIEDEFYTIGGEADRISQESDDVEQLRNLWRPVRAGVACYRIEGEADRISQESDDGEQPRNICRSIARREVEIPPVTGDRPAVEVPPATDDRHAVEITPVTDDRGKSISVIFTDPEVLDCCICYETLSAPIFQCENGHIACSSCCVKLGNKCPICSMPIGYNRCRALEKVLESVKVSCSNAAYGCKDLLGYSTRNEHEKECIYVPCLCPQSGCDAVASSKELSLHFRQIHFGSGISFQYDCHFSFDLQPESKVTVMQEKNDGNLFILNNIVETLGNLVFVNGIGPNSSSSEFRYDLYAKSEGCYLELQSSMGFSQGHIANTPPSKFLLIPTDFLGSHGQITLGICIQRVKPQIQHMQQGS